MLLVDLDPQASTAGWWRARAADTPHMEETTPDKLPALLATAQKNGIDFCIIDTRPSVEADAIQVAALSDFVLIPTRPAMLDLRAILATLDIVKSSRMPAAIVLNACPAGRWVGEASVTIEARRALKAFPVPVCPTVIGQRAALAHALVAGLAVSETEPDGKAAKEIRALWRFIEKELSK